MQNFPRQYLTLMILCVSLVVTCCGCETKSYSLVEVSGRVTKQGKPIAGANVFFQPMTTANSINPGPGSFGLTNSDGYYELKTVRDKRLGAVVGKHRVMINLPLPPGVPTDGTADPSYLSPIQFRDGSTQIEITEKGLEKADFELEKKS